MQLHLLDEPEALICSNFARQADISHGMHTERQQNCNSATESHGAIDPYLTLVGFIVFH